MKIPLTCRILYVEDDKECSEMMKVLLGFAGIDVITVRKIAEAWMLAQSEKFDLFLLDSQFSDGDGLELCICLRRHFLNVPIFFYSGLAYQTDKQKGLAAGADKYLIKPNIDNVAEKILSAVKLARKNEIQFNLQELGEPKAERSASVSRIYSLKSEKTLINLQC